MLAAAMFRPATVPSPRSSPRASDRALVLLLAVLVGAGTLALSPSASGEDPARARDGVTIASAEPLLESAQHGRAAIQQLGDRLATAAARNDMRPAELRSLLREDRSVWVDPQGAVLFIDPKSEQEAGAAAAAPTPSPVAPLAETFALHSNPGAPLTILLDFDGGAVSGTGWNDHYGVTPASHPAWDPAGDGAAFDASERLLVQQVWAMVAEDYAPFQVDVTTEDPGEEGLLRSSSADGVHGTRVLISPSDDPFAKICSRGCGGVAYLSVFGRVGSYYQPAWVFPQALGNNPKNIAEAVAHEAGHNLGLEHDGTSSQGYYAGHGAWAPIMGVGYQRPLVQWSAGSYAGATNHQDDLTVLEGYLGARPDEASSSVATPSSLPVESAVIGSPADVDTYFLGSCTAGSEVEVLPAEVAPNLDVRAALVDAGGAELSVAQPVSGFGDGTTASGLGAALVVPENGDGWVLRVEGSGQGTWTSGGYDDYGSLGAYTVQAPGCDGKLADGVPSTPNGVTASVGGTGSLALAWSAPSAAGSGPITGYVVTRSGSTTTETLPADARSHTFTGLAPGTTYQLSVRAVNASGAGQSVTVSATTSEPTPAAPSAPRDLTGAYDQQTGTLQAWWAEPEDTGTEPVRGYAIHLDGAYVGELPATSRGVDITRSSGFVEGSYVVGIAAVSAAGWSPVSEVTIVVRPPDRPANDDVADAELLSGATGSVAGDNTHATRETTDPTPPGSYGAGNYSVWYSWTPTSGGAVTLSTSGGGEGRDTTLAAYSGAPGALVQVAGDDDTLGSHATISFDATAGTRYLVAVDGFATGVGTGPFTLGWSQRIPTVPSAPQQVRALPGDSAATVSWNPAVANGSAIRGYTVTSSPGGVTRTVAGAETASTSITGLSNGTLYTFTVVATNGVGDSSASQPSAGIVPAGAPARVAKPTARVVGRTVSLRWRAPDSNGSPVTGYVVTSNKTSKKVVGATTRRAVFKRLGRGTYKFRVAAVNAVGKGSRSAAVRVRVR